MPRARSVRSQQGPSCRGRPCRCQSLPPVAPVRSSSLQLASSVSRYLRTAQGSLSIRDARWLSWAMASSSAGLKAGRSDKVNRHERDWSVVVQPYTITP